MKKANPKQKIDPENSELDSRVKNADPMIQIAFKAYRDEIARLQKQLVKEQLAHESEIANLLAQIEQRKQIQVVFDDGDRGVL